MCGKGKREPTQRPPPTWPTHRSQAGNIRQISQKDGAVARDPSLAVEADHSICHVLEGAPLQQENGVLLWIEASAAARAISLEQLDLNEVGTAGWGWGGE